MCGLLLELQLHSSHDVHSRYLQFTIRQAALEICMPMEVPAHKVKLFVPEAGPTS